jgi:hypothetical protein
MKELAPEDTQVINEFISVARAMSRVNRNMDKAPELSNPFDMIKMIPSMLPWGVQKRLRI